MKRVKVPSTESNFVQSLQNVKHKQNLLTERNSLKAASLSLKPGNKAIEKSQADFDGDAIVEPDSMFPNIRLVKRYLSSVEIQQSIPSHTDVLTITELYKQVSPPNFQRPVTASANFMILGIVATRSESRTSAQGNQFVIMTLSDLKYDISLALHSKAREKYWKIRPGTLIAVFNPKFYVQKAENIARNLALSCSKDSCILEVGQAKDLGQCDATTSASHNSKRCKNWVDVRKSHVCDFHVEQMLSKSKRPEFNAASAKLWDPQSTAASNGKRLTVVRGGEVSWKRGLQIDTQFKKSKPGSKYHDSFDNLGGHEGKSFTASTQREFPDAPVGNIYQRTKPSQSLDPMRYEESLETSQKRLQRERRQLERVTDDAKLSEQLASNTSKNMHSVPINAEVGVRGGEATRNKLRKLGILSAGSKRLRQARSSKDSDDELIIY